MEFIQADTIDQYNRFFGIKTRHPSILTVKRNSNPIEWFLDSMPCS